MTHGRSGVLPVDVDVLQTTELPAVGLHLLLVIDRGIRYLLLQSSLHASQTLLLPAGPTQPLQGLALHTRLGRLHARPWALVWSPGAAPTGEVHLSSGELRWRREADATPVQLGPVWVAGAEGVYRTASTAAGERLVLGRHA